MTVKDPKSNVNLSTSSLKRLLIGRPFPTRADVDERLDKVRGLAIFASDPISSNAYATEAIMTVLILMGSGALALAMPIALGIFVLVVLVIFSYVQTIRHYPDGGGAYIVARDNLGETPSLLAAGALLVDYILTVAVSVSAGVRAISSAVPAAHDYRVIIALLAVAFLTWINLRGVRESGTVFALPTYAFVGGVLTVVGLGLARAMGLLGASPLPQGTETVAPAVAVTDFLFIWLVLRAFAAGCTALTGIEAISNGVQAFKLPSARNAIITMVVMGVMAMSLFLSISFLSSSMHLIPMEEESILSQMTRSIAGAGVLYYWVQFFTMLILILAANTGYQAFPQLASYLAKDGFMPRWMQNRGDRLVYNGGIVMLAAMAGILIILFRADEIAMLPLYAIGVMLSFTLSQLGMVRLMGRVGRLKPGETARTKATIIHHESDWRRKQVMNLVGGVATLIVTAVLVATKFVEGAWVVVLAIPLLVLLFRSISQHYQTVADHLTTTNLSVDQLTEIADVVVVPMADVHRGTLRALRYALRISDDVRALCISTSNEMRARFEERWNRFPEITGRCKLVIIDYEYRDILTPLVDYIEHVNNVEHPNQLVTVVVPEFVSDSFTGQLLHNQTANILRRRLRLHEDIVVIDVPFHLYGSNGNGKNGAS
jgi:amino acid transporter